MLNGWIFKELFLYLFWDSKTLRLAQIPKLLMIAFRRHAGEGWVYKTVYTWVLKDRNKNKKEQNLI
jgi:hypothetical protein